MCCGTGKSSFDVLSAWLGGAFYRSLPRANQISQPRAPSKLVGGDFYDLLDLGEGRFGFTLGGVSGKGFPAAVMMASVHTLLRRLILHEPGNPARVITELNEAIHDSSTPDRYSTLSCGTLTAARNELLYVNAEHVQPVIIRAESGKAEILNGGDLPVGLLPGVTYFQHRQPIGPGDLIACISDGITEAENPQGEFWGQLENAGDPVPGTGASCKRIAEYPDIRGRCLHFRR